MAIQKRLYHNIGQPDIQGSPHLVVEIQKHISDDKLTGRVLMRMSGIGPGFPGPIPDNTR